MITDRQPHTLDRDDDLVAMELSTLSTFVDEGQLAVLLTLWQAREPGDNNAFMDLFVKKTELPAFPEGSEWPEE